MPQDALDELAEKREPRAKPATIEANQPVLEERRLDDVVIREQEPINKLDEGLVYDLIHQRLRSDYKPRESSGFVMGAEEVEEECQSLPLLQRHLLISTLVNEVHHLFLSLK